MNRLGSTAGSVFGGDTDMSGSALGLDNAFPMPSDLNRAGAIIAGQEDPAIKQQAVNLQTAAMIGELRQRREQIKRQSLNDFLDFAVKLDLDDETTTKITKLAISANPQLKEYFGSQLENLSVSAKSKTPLIITRKFGENELPDISRPGTFMPAGTYKLKGVMRQGQFTPTEIEPAPTLTEKQGGETNTIRQQFNTLSKDFREVAASYSQIETVVNAKPSAAGDLTLIFSFMKMLDPTSVVREGEQATAASARGVPDTVRNLYNRVLTGQRLTPEQRADFLGQSANVFKARLSQQDLLEKQYTGLAERAGTDPKDIVIDYVGKYRKLLGAQPNAQGILEYVRDPKTGKLVPNQ